MKTLRNLEVAGGMFQADGVTPAKVGDTVRLFLDQDSVASFPEYISGTIIHPVTAIECGSKLSYNIEYDTEFIVRTCDVLDWAVTTEVVLSQDDLDAEAAARAQGDADEAAARIAGDAAEAAARTAAIAVEAAARIAGDADGLPRTREIVEESANNLTLTADHEGKTVVLTGDYCTVTIPSGLPVGFWCDVLPIGEGLTGVSRINGGAGVTLNKKSTGLFTLRVGWAPVRVVSYDTNMFSADQSGSPTTVDGSGDTFSPTTEHLGTHVRLSHPSGCVITVNPIFTVPDFISGEIHFYRVSGAGFPSLVEGVGVTINNKEIVEAISEGGEFILRFVEPNKFDCIVSEAVGLENTLNALNLPEYVDDTAANAAVSVGDAWWDTTLLKVRVRIS